MLQKKPTTRPGQPATRKVSTASSDCGRELVAVQPHQLRVPGEIGDLREIDRVVLACEDPADMRVEEAGVPGRMDVVLGIGVQVVVAVLGSPPQHALLGRGLGEEARMNWNTRLVA